MKIMSSLEEYKQLKEDEKKIEKKIAGNITPEELEKIFPELEKIILRKTEIRHNQKFLD
jgi:hypothetical protein